MAQSALVLSIGDLGTRNINIRSISRDSFKSKNIIVNGTILRIVTVFVLCIIYFIYNSFFGTLSNLYIIYLFIYVTITCLSNLYETAFIGFQRMMPIATANVLHGAIWLILLFFLGNKIEVNNLLIVYLVLTLIKCIIQFWYLKSSKLILGNSENLSQSIKQILKESWPYFALTLVMTPINGMSNVFLDLNSTKAEIGYFNLSQKLTSPVSVVTGIALATIFPNLSSIWVTDKARFQTAIKRGVVIFIILLLSLSLVITVLADEIVDWLFSVEYKQAYIICQLQIWFIFLMGVNSFIGTVWGATNKEKLILKTGIYNALFSTPFLYYGSKFGSYGLSVSFVVTFAVYEIYLWILFVKTERLQIKNEIWLIVLIMFVLSFFYISKLSLLMKLMFLVICLAFLFYYSLKLLNSSEKSD